MISNTESALAGTSRLVKDRSQKSGSIQERSLTKLALCGSTLQYGALRSLMCMTSVVVSGVDDNFVVRDKKLSYR